MLASKIDIATARLIAATCRRALPIKGTPRKPITPVKCKLMLMYVNPLQCGAAQLVNEVTGSPVVQRTSASMLFLSIVEPEVNIRLEKPFVFDKRVFVE